MKDDSQSNPADVLVERIVKPGSHAKVFGTVIQDTDSLFDKVSGLILGELIYLQQCQGFRNDGAVYVRFLQY